MIIKSLLDCDCYKLSMGQVEAMITRAFELLAEEQASAKELADKWNYSPGEWEEFKKWKASKPVEWAGLIDEIKKICEEHKFTATNFGYNQILQMLPRYQKPQESLVELAGKKGYTINNCCGTKVFRSITR